MESALIYSTSIFLSDSNEKKYIKRTDLAAYHCDLGDNISRKYDGHIRIDRLETMHETYTIGNLPYAVLLDNAEAMHR